MDQMTETQKHRSLAKIAKHAKKKKNKTPCVPFALFASFARELCPYSSSLTETTFETPGSSIVTP